jgi:hypothetical protein
MNMASVVIVGALRNYAIDGARPIYNRIGYYERKHLYHTPIQRRVPCPSGKGCWGGAIVAVAYVPQACPVVTSVAFCVDIYEKLRKLLAEVFA